MIDSSWSQFKIENERDGLSAQLFLAVVNEFCPIVILFKSNRLLIMNSFTYMKLSFPIDIDCSKLNALKSNIVNKLELHALLGIDNDVEYSFKLFK